MGNFDDEERGERLPGELGNGCNGADERVLVSGEVGVSLETKEGAISKHALVENLKEVDPDQNDEDDFVSLVANSLVLKVAHIRWRLRRRNRVDRHTSSSLTSIRDSPTKARALSPCLKEARRMSSLE